MPLMPFLINPPKGARRRAVTTGAITTTVTVSPTAASPTSTRARTSTGGAKTSTGGATTSTNGARRRRVKRDRKGWKNPRGKRKRKFSVAQLAAQRKFAAMVRERASQARKARSTGDVSETPRRTGGSMATRRKKHRASTRRRRRLSVSANPRRRRRRVHHTIAANPRRRRRHTYSANPRRRHSRRYRRNPGLGGSSGIVKMLVAGVKDGFVVTLGRGVTKLVASKIPFGQTSAIGTGAMQLLVGAGLAYGVRKVTKSERTAAFFLAGAASNVIQTLLAPIPVLGPALSGVDSWPRVGVGAWARELPPANMRTVALGIGAVAGDDGADGIYS